MGKALAFWTKLVWYWCHITAGFLFHHHTCMSTCLNSHLLIPLGISAPQFIKSTVIMCSSPSPVRIYLCLLHAFYTGSLHFARAAVHHSHRAIIIQIPYVKTILTDVTLHWIANWPGRTVWILCTCTHFLQAWTKTSEYTEAVWISAYALPSMSSSFHHDL